MQLCSRGAPEAPGVHRYDTRRTGPSLASRVSPSPSASSSSSSGLGGRAGVPEPPCAGAPGNTWVENVGKRLPCNSNFESGTAFTRCCRLLFLSPSAVREKHAGPHLSLACESLPESVSFTRSLSLSPHAKPPREGAAPKGPRVPCLAGDAFTSLTLSLSFSLSVGPAPNLSLPLSLSLSLSLSLPLPLSSSAAGFSLSLSLSLSWYCHESRQEWPQ